ncbi:hypothetical protein MML48_9g00003656 [Holotrichia oblita]|uniref:Uncharacterized protein n=1 Tax=Holotrichia oblita TaxID=644536 RepID=A0ACB9SJU6_HOLOL|nr:hypothetical protein MML48_9g00003656 [Holotrichia oblita]
MVRHYVRKSNRGKGYTKEILLKAVEEVKSNKLTITEAANRYNIPRPTLVDRVRGRRGLKSNTYGRTPVLRADVEKKLSELLKVMEKYGYGLSRKNTLTLVGDYIRENRIPTPFRNGVPGEDWWLGFKQRHNLSLKKPQLVEVARKKICDPFIINGYFDLLENTINELQLENKLDNIWNLDETAFCSDPSRTKTIGAKGFAATRTSAGSGKENTTVLLACSAAGSKVPPLFIFRGKNVWTEWISPKGSGFPDTTYAATTNGWMETNVFNNYFQKSFLKVANPSPTNPVLLIYDGHATHINLQLIELAQSNNVTIILLPPHSSHLLQPLDLAVFKSIKSSWDEYLSNWMRNHRGQKIPKKKLAQTIGELWLSLKPEIIQNGFRKAGIAPFNRGVISKDKYDPLSWKRWENELKTRQELQIPSQTESSNEPSTTTILSIPSTSGIDADALENTERTSLTTAVVEFEQLLVKTLQSEPLQKKPRKKIADGALVITSDEAAQIIRDKQVNQRQNKKNTPDVRYESDREEESEEMTLEESGDEDIDSLIARNVQEEKGEKILLIEQ